METHDAPKPAFRFSWLATTLFFLAVALAATWPLAAHFAAAVPAGSHDLHQNLWGFWWWRTAVVDQNASPFFTNMLYAPDGLDITFHTHSSLNMIMTFGVNLLWGPMAAYNTAVILAVFLCGLGAYLLVREITGDYLAALGGGLIYALFPQHLEQLFEHLNLFSCQFIPFTLYFLIRTFRTGRLSHGLLTGVFFALNALASWHLGLLLILLGIPCFLWYACTSKCKLRAFGMLFPGALLCVIMLSPFLWPMVSGWMDGDAYFVKPKVYRPIDPAFLVIPPPQSTLLGGLTEDIYRQHRGGPEALFKSQYAGFICFLGWTPLLLMGLALVGAFKRRHRRGDIILWLMVFGVFLVLSCGTHLLFFGQEYPGASLPQKWLMQDPDGGFWAPVTLFFRVMRVSNRYLIPASVALAVLAAAGLAGLRAKWLKGALVTVILVEFLWTPFPIKTLDFHPQLRALADNPETGIVLDIPPCSEAAHVDNMLRQTIHGAPLAGGYVACVSPEKKKYIADMFGDVRIQKKPPRITPAFIDRLEKIGVNTIMVRPAETREACLKKQEARLAVGTLPFYFKELRPNRFFPERQLEQMIDGLYRYLGDPDFEDKELLIWHLKPAKK